MERIGLLSASIRLTHRVRHAWIRIAIGIEIMRRGARESRRCQPLRQKTFLQPEGGVAWILLDEIVAAAASAAGVRIADAGAGTRKRASRCCSALTLR